VNPEYDDYSPPRRDYAPMSPGDLVAVRRSTITAAEGSRGYIVRQYWTHGELVCVIQLFARRSPSRLFIQDLLKISNT
jgi:hypothetical protein